MTERRKSGLRPMTFLEALQTGKPMRRRRAHPTSIAAQWHQMVTTGTPEGGRRSYWRQSKDGVTWTTCLVCSLPESDLKKKDWEVAS